MNEELKNILEQQLRDAHTPEAISWWPLAYGWWALILLSVIFVVAGYILRRRFNHQNAYRKVAALELDQVYSLWEEENQNHRYLQAANAILKRVCLRLNNQSAKLSGGSWIDHLNGYATEPLSEATSLALSQQLYRAQSDSDIDLVHVEIKQWLLTHRTVQAEQHIELEKKHA